MNIETAMLPQISSNLIAIMKEDLYSEQTQGEYQRTYQQFYLYLNKNNVSHFNKEVGLSFIDECYGFREKQVSRNYLIFLKRQVNILFEFYSEGAIITKKFGKKIPQLITFENTLNFYIADQMKRNISPRTIKAKTFRVKQFLTYLEDIGVKSLLDVRTENVHKYIETMKGHAVSTREAALYTLRDALRYLTKNGLCNKELGDMFPQISAPTESPVPSCFSATEVKGILSSVDRRSSAGKKDYAVIILAALLGMRAGEIRELKISDIKWASENIEFTQSKTNNFLQLPLLPEIKFAILDYLKNSRPDINSDYVFVKHKAPYTPYSAPYCFHGVLQKYLDHIDLKGRKHGLHALRFSAAGNMLSNGTPITTICNVLGHSYSDTTKRYLKIDIENLRKAALEVV